MAAYIVAHIEVTDPQAFEAYRAAVPKLIEKYGGRYLVRGGAVEVLEGDWKVPRLVIIAFDDAEQAKAFYNSKDYQEIVPLRLAGSRGDLVVVEGV